MPEFKIESENVSFWLRVRPRATRERLTVDAGDELRLELHAPATEGQANEACIYFFAHALRLPQACVVILSGHKARRKLLRVTGRPAEDTITAIRTLAGLPERTAEAENRNLKSARVSSFAFRVSNPAGEEKKH